MLLFVAGGGEDMSLPQRGTVRDFLYGSHDGLDLFSTIRKRKSSYLI